MKKEISRIVLASLFVMVMSFTSANAINFKLYSVSENQTSAVSNYVETGSDASSGSYSYWTLFEYYSVPSWLDMTLNISEISSDPGYFYVSADNVQISGADDYGAGYFRIYGSCFVTISASNDLGHYQQWTIWITIY